VSRAERSAASADHESVIGEASRGSARGIAMGYLAMLPLLLAYEISAGGPARNLAEVVLSLPLAPLGTGQRAARVSLLALSAVAALRSIFHRRLGLLPRLWRILLEGGIAALLLGPALLVLMSVLGANSGAEHFGHGRAGPGLPLELAAFLAGGAAWEEMLFRIGVQSAVFLLASHLLAFLTGSLPLARAGAEILSIGAAGLVFAASHLAVFTQVLGPGGEVFDAAVFTWRLLAGILLGALFRWRGPGVAAWAHALFDLFLAIGARPEVFL
jgi:hypothetical protein